MADPVPSTDPSRDDPDDTDRPRPRHRHRRQRGRKKGSFWRELPILLVTALVLTFLIQTFLARVYVIPSASMEQTLQGCTGCTNDRVLVDKVVYRFGEPSPGDVVVFRGPDSWAGSAEFERSEPDNVLPYIFLAGGQPQESFPPVTVPEDHLWVMGDNRNNSADSRRHVDDDANGTIPIDNVIGKTRAIVLPPDRWRGVDDPNPQAIAVGRH